MIVSLFCQAKIPNVHRIHWIHWQRAYAMFKKLFIKPWLLKEGAHQLSNSRSRLFNASLQTGHFPSIWKRANVIKKRQIMQLPISITYQLCRKSNGANFVQITLWIFPRQLLDIGVAIGIHSETLYSYPPGGGCIIHISKQHRKESKYQRCSVTLVAHLIISGNKGFYLS